MIEFILKYVTQKKKYSYGFQRGTKYIQKARKSEKLASICIPLSSCINWGQMHACMCNTLTSRSFDYVIGLHMLCMHESVYLEEFSFMSISPP